MNRKKTYRRPQTRSIALQGPRLMLTASVAVNEYYRGNDISVGDTDDE
ncbi:MAG: hypothetical protein IKQ58_09290 [Prevotella sp.]|nr:hypothetical protein [Prevotella sp.]